MNLKKIMLGLTVTVIATLAVGKLAHAQQDGEESALPAGEYAWTIDVRCITEELCKAAFGGESPIPPWWDSFSFAGHITSDGETMTYSGADVFRGRAGAGPAGACDAPFETPFSGVCIFGEQGEAFVKTSENPSPILQGKASIWIRNATLYQPRADAENYTTPCPCGPEGEDEMTPATPGTYTTKDFFGGKKPVGVSVNVQLVKLP
jgi:hypothetical protein